MKKLYYIISLILIFGLTVFAFVSCGGKNEPLENGQSTGSVLIQSKALTIDGNELRATFPYGTEEFSFYEDITVDQNATFIVGMDVNCSYVLESKVAELSTGENHFYILVKNGNQTKTYNVKITVLAGYTVTFNTDGGSDVPSQTVGKGGYAVIPTEPARIGYEFAGWDHDFSAPITQDVTVKALWNPRSDTQYKVEYYLESTDGSTFLLSETLQYTGTTNSLVNEVPKSIDHFNYIASMSCAEGTVLADGSLVLRLYYTRELCTVSFEISIPEAATVDGTGTHHYGSEITLLVTAAPGYTVQSIYIGNEEITASDRKITVDSDKLIRVNVVENENTPYKVLHYVESLSGEGYDVYEEENLTAKTASTVSASAENYEHFIYNSEESLTTGKVAGDGSTELKLYYKRARYTVSASALDKVGGTVSEGGEYPYGAAITLTATLDQCYAFLGWYDGESIVCEKSEFSFEVKGNITYSAKWTISHTSGEAARENNVDPTCTLGGSYESVIYCSVCNIELSREKVEVSKTGHNYLDGICTECGDGNIPKDKAYVRHGNYIYFGEYPQTLKADGVEIMTMTDSRGYYLGSDGNYYAKISATPWRADYKFGNNEVITNGNVYYFKVEPIRWRILEEKNGEALILCESVIASLSYQDDYFYDSVNNEYYTKANGAPDGTFANNYKYSAVRAWLLGEFYETAFSDLGRQLILSTEVNNGDASMGGLDSNNYSCENTVDSVFLLSYEEIMKSEYGFDSSDALKMRASDYARATGVYMNTGSSYYGNAWWWQRSPNTDFSDCVSVVDSGANVSFNYVYINGGGILPALRIALNK